MPWIAGDLRVDALDARRFAAVDRFERRLATRALMTRRFPSTVTACTVFFKTFIRRLPLPPLPRSMTCMVKWASVSATMVLAEPT